MGVGRERAIGQGARHYYLWGGGRGGGGSHFAGESFSKSWLVSGGHFHIRERYLCSHFNKFNDSNAKQEQV